MIRTFDKLVRDNIPDLITAKGETPIIRVVEGIEYEHYLIHKLIEEKNELIQAINCGEKEYVMEESADLLEVIIAILKHKGISQFDFNKCLVEKRELNGAFIKRFILDKVLEKGDVLEDGNV